MSEEEVPHQPNEDGFDAVAAVAATRVAHDEALVDDEAGTERHVDGQPPARRVA